MKYIFFVAVLFCVATACKQEKKENRNVQASFPVSFTFNQAELKAITSSINPNAGTTSTLYGNTAALQALKYDDVQPGEEKKLVLITWTQKEDERWWGAKIPGTIKNAEVIQTSTSLSDLEHITYLRYNGAQLQLSSDTSHREERLHSILAMKPSVMP
ncbi:MAG: hypothetical protein J0I41_03285 [Filimonas sp.]|nr:hypothetical protein [Filimonas sp.]